MYHQDSNIIPDILGRFNIELPEYIALIRFEVITPDSFMWRLLISEHIYYLYAEDYVPSLSHIKSLFDQYIENTEWSFVKPRKVIHFEDASPVKGATTYAPPDASDNMMRYALDSGYDFVFLARSSEDATNAFFSDTAPRGFTF